MCTPALSLRSQVLALALDRYGTEPEKPWAKYPSYAVLRHPNQKWYGVVMDVPRCKLDLAGEGLVCVLNVKCDLLMIGSLRMQPGILPGYHMNKDNWLSVLLDGTVSIQQVGLLMAVSYDLAGVKNKRRRQIAFR